MKRMKPSIFKAYDIRGLSPGEISAADAKKIGQAIAVEFQPKHVVVGKDMRVTSDELERELVEGFLSQGVNVTRIGLCSTPLFNFAIGSSEGKYDLGVMVTASHNPASYNGFKITKGDNIPVGKGSGMEEIRDRAAGAHNIPPGEKRGSSDKDNSVLARYLDHLFASADLPELPEIKIAVDAGNGMNGLILPELAKRLPQIEIMDLYWELDGSFPNHEANPIKEETLEDLRKAVKENKCGFGVAFDGDGDRVGFVDEKGAPIPGDILTALFALELLTDHPKEKILYDLRSSWSVPEAVEEAGGISEMTRVGHAFIKREMKEKKALFAGELSMHFYFREFQNCESGDFAMLLLLKMLARESEPLSKLWKPLLRYAHSGEINFEVENAKNIIKKLKKHYEAAATDLSEIDGLRMEFRSGEKGDWWFNVRPSNTEPLLRLNLEAKDAKEMKKRREEVSALIKEFDA